MKKEGVQLDPLAEHHLQMIRLQGQNRDWRAHCSTIQPTEIGLGISADTALKRIAYLHS